MIEQGGCLVQIFHMLSPVFYHRSAIIPCKHLGKPVFFDASTYDNLKIVGYNTIYGE